ncbi:peptide MFS transporter [Hymenobacter busanensis]|uniref:Peptide MFS transporter n=1 Tax=Hymenobacter busanensis TaxID=2607656 RepID=A0A7L4ZVK3_9BACT|nr:peptide MFS transporter [Hymenobacter busanensis]KAA9325919.1 peptide MFS transporter [Hymenobacter busanensis]QHJ06242.1 MFS transporter [Hymenobacter busanensis]
MQSTSTLSQPPASVASTSHPKGLYVLFMTEMWERFSFYGMRALLSLYMGKALLFDKALTSRFYGNYTSLVYLTPLLGGYLADRYWGNRRSILIGGLLMAVGQFCLFGSASLYVVGQAEAGTTQQWLFFLGLGFLIFGNGSFKPNISSMVGSLYPANDKRIDAAYTIFYMGINIGAFLAPLVCGYLGDTKNPADFKWGFLAAGFGMLLATAIFELCKHRYVVDAHGAPLGARPERRVAASPVVPRTPDAPVRAETVAAPATGISAGRLLQLAALFAAVYAAIAWYMDRDWFGALVFAAMLVVPLVVLSDASLTAREKEKIYVIFILSFFVIFFWGAYEQAGASLTFFADEQTDRQLGAYTMPASYFQSAPALFVILLAPLFAVGWTTLGRRGLDPSSPLKMSIGLLLLGVGYLIIAFGVHGVVASTKVSMFWLIAMYLFHVFGELCLSPIGLALVNKLAPLRFASLLMAVWFMATAAGNKLAGVLSGLYPEPGKAAPHFLGVEISGLYEFFLMFVALSFASSLVLFLIQRRLTRLMSEPDSAA